MLDVLIQPRPVGWQIGVRIGSLWYGSQHWMWLTLYEENALPYSGTSPLCSVEGERRKTTEALLVEGAPQRRTALALLALYGIDLLISASKKEQLNAYLLYTPLLIVIVTYR